MKPKKSPIENPQNELFRTKLVDIINPKHALVILAHSVDWQGLEQEFGKFFCQKNGAPALPVRLMIGLEFLKQMEGLSDERTLYYFVQSPYYQYFCGRKYFEHKRACDSSSMTKWRGRLKEKGAEKLLSETLKSGLKLKIIKKSELKRVNIDTSVQPKNVRFPTDSRTKDRMREHLVKGAINLNINLRQNYNHLSKKSLRRHSGYSRANQFKRARKEQKKIHNYLGRIVRDIERKLAKKLGKKLGKEFKKENEETLLKMREKLALAKRILAQERKSKNKVYSVHEPDVECIAKGKGKAGKRYEFGSKVSIATTARTNWVVGALSFAGNPYDGHTYEQAKQQIERQTLTNIELATLDRGYRCEQVKDDAKALIANLQRKRLKSSARFWMRRRSAIEPVIGHMKSEHHLGLNRLKGVEGDKLNVILAAAGKNMRKLLKSIERFSLVYFARIIWRHFLRILGKKTQNLFTNLLLNFIPRQNFVRI